MKIITINLNGIRSAHKKGFFNWLKDVDADIICMQEIRADIADIPKEVINFNGYYTEFHLAQKKGYSGVAIFAKEKPDNIVIGLNNEEIDNEGRYLQFDYQDFSVASIYLPSGSSGPDKQEKKFRFLDFYAPLLKQQANSNREYILCGDMNIAHQEIDLKNWKGNLKNSGFLPEERAWMSDVLRNGYIDAFRYLHPEAPGYTWWSNRGQAYSKDVGWRIDYQLLTEQMAINLKHASVFKEIKFSDHAPLIMEYKL